MSDDKAIALICSVDESPWRVIRDHYEDDRAKWMELVQVLVDALADPHKMSLGANAMQLAAERGIKPTL